MVRRWVLNHSGPVWSDGNRCSGIQWMDGASAGAKSLWPSVIRWKLVFNSNWKNIKNRRGEGGYVSYFLEWPVPPCRKRKYVPIVPNRARTHAFPSLWGASVNEWMNERCPPIIILGMHHSPSSRFLKFSNNRCGYITTIPKFSRKKKKV
jgi:hypothetical protein